MQLFYTPNLELNATHFIFDKEESKHIVKVLRKSAGDVINSTNGKGVFFELQIELALEKKCSVVVLSSKAVAPKPYLLHIAVAPTKNNDRIEWFLEKATEIGIDSITPIICDHSERKVFKTDRGEKIILAAMKQSLHAYKPILKEPISFTDFVNAKRSGNLYIAHCDEQHKTQLKNAVQPNQEYTILIGPEGDFSSKEIDLALKNNFQHISLGETRLRTETAALVACHSIAFINE